MFSENKIFLLFNRYSFIIGASLLIIFETINIFKGQWIGDFWEHSAVVNELSKHLVHPNNPIIKSNTPHAFFSPYALIVAVFSKITNLNSIQSLEVFAFINLVFLLSTFYLFCKSVFRDNYNLVATISLFFILFLLEKNPFYWSGFYHILTLRFVLPYPSTFAISLAFLILAMVASNLNHKQSLNWIIIIILNAVVLLTHPTTAIFLYISIIAFNFTNINYSIKQRIVKSFVIVPGIFLCLLWPYYNFIDLMFGNSIDFHSDSLVLYGGVIKRMWPYVLIIPGLFLIKKDSVVNFFITAIFLMTIIYVGGYVFKIYGVARVLSNIMMFTNFLMAYIVVLLFKDLRFFGKVYIITIFIALCTSLYLNHMALLSAFNIFKSRGIEYYNKYDFLRYCVTSDAIILSDKNSNWYIPSFNGKVISSVNPLYWVEDINDRRNAVESFFIATNSDSLRHEIIQKYQPDYILLDYAEIQLSSSTIQWLESLGKAIYKENQLELIEIKM